MEGLEESKKNNNALIFVYGNTGTGKTHTMGLLQELSKTSAGIVPHSFTYIFNKIKQSPKQI
jgi:Cdc6-like AAA superfamily ATPase